MKKKFTYLWLLIAFAAASGFIVLKYNYGEKQHEAVMYGLADRKGPSEQTPEWATVQAHATALLEAIKKNPADIKSRLALTSLFIQEARITGNYVYYDMAAMKYIN